MLNENCHRNQYPLLPKIASLAFGLLLTSQVFALSITGGSFDGTDVGAIDILKGEITSTDFNSTYGPGGSPALEEQWAEDVLGIDVTFGDSSKTETVDWYDTDTTDVIAFQLQFGGGYYVLKNAQARVLLQNVADLAWGVLDLSALDVNLNLGDDMTISHITEDSNPITPEPAPGVPVPAPLALFGLGGLMLGWSMKRQSRA